jgi:DNA-binding CsgD family transcriptional regulator
VKNISFLLLLFFNITLSQNIIKSEDIGEQIIKLNHEIEFYWQQEPYNDTHNFDTSVLKNPQKIQFPKAFWTKVNNTKGKGYGTFQYHITLPDTEHIYSLYTPRFLGGCKIWINNILKQSHGNYSKELEKSTSYGKPLAIDLPKQKNVTVTFLTSNSDDFLGGGFNYFLAAGKKSVIDNYLKKELVKDYVVFLLLLMLSLYLFYLYYIYKKVRYLYLMLACFTGVIRNICIQQHIIYNMLPFEVPFYIIQKLRLMTVYMGTIFTLLYYKTLLPRQIHRRWFQFLVLIQVIGLSLYFFVSVYQANILAKIMRLLFLISILYCVYLAIIAFVKKEKYSKEILLSITFILVIAINGVLKTGVIINSAYVGVTALFVYLLAHMYINAKIQRNQSLTVQALSSTLKNKEKENQKLKLETLSRIQEKERIKTSLKDLPNKTNEIKTVLAFIQSNSKDDEKAKLLKEELEIDLTNFTNNLHLKHPYLTKTDIEIAIYIVLDKTRKEIANLRGITITSVKTSRNRLRKKLELPKEVLLDDYLKSIL